MNYDPNEVNYSFEQQDLLDFGYSEATNPEATAFDNPPVEYYENGRVARYANIAYPSLRYNPLASFQVFSFDEEPIFVQDPYLHLTTIPQINRAVLTGSTQYDPNCDLFSLPDTLSSMTSNDALFPNNLPTPAYESIDHQLDPTLPSDLSPQPKSPNQLSNGCTSNARTGSRSEGPVLICPGCQKRHTRKNRMKDCSSRDKNMKRHPCGGQCGNPNCTMEYVSADGLRRHKWPKELRQVLCPYCKDPSSRQNIARHKKTCPRRPIQ